MDLEGANVTSNVNATETPTTTETAIAMDVATSSNGDTVFTPNMNTIQTPNTIETSRVVEVSTSSNADTKDTANVQSINTTETPNAMELSTSNKVDTTMMIDGSSSVAMLKVMVDEREDSKEWKTSSSMVTESFEQLILEQSVRVENYNHEENAGNSPLLQDDMFSLAELSVVENQQLDETTTVYCPDIVTPVSDRYYESLHGSGQLATNISGSGENVLQGVTKVTESIKSPMPIDDTNGKENIEQVIAHADVGDATNGSIGDLENDYTCIDHIPNAGDARAGHDGGVKDHTNNIPNIALATTRAVYHENKIDNGHLHKNEGDSVHGNQVTLSMSQPEAVMVKEMNDTDDSTQAERAAMKEEQGSLNKQQLGMASVKEEEACQQNLPERIPCVKHAELEVKEQSEDKKSEEIEIPISGMASNINGGCVDMDIDHPSQGPSENLMQANNMPQEIVSIKEEIDPHELSENIMLLEKASENSPKIASQNINLEGANTESHTEHIEYKDGDQLQEISEEFELLKGRKVYKKFGRKKYLGEVIGYDLTTKWFKVLYEDGDEEEVEKNELDSVLLPLDGKLVASRKRRLPTNDDDHEDANRTGRKSIKLNMQATQRKPGKIETAGNEITVSNRLSSSNKKTKPSAVKSGGKRKSTKVSVPKTQKAKNQSAAGKKSIEKEKSQKKSQSTQSKRKTDNQMKQSSSKKPNVVAENQSQSITRKLKYGSAKKKTSTKANKKAEEIPPEDKEVKTPQLSMAEKSAAAVSGRKRKAGTDVQGRASMLSGKRARREMVNDVESSPLRKTEPKRRRIPEDSTEVKPKNNDTNDDSISLATGKTHLRSDKGSVLVGRKVRKDFGGELYGGEIVGYKMYYNVKYDDGDTEDLTWKELEPILLTEQGGSSQPNHDKHNMEIEVNPVKSKQKKKN